MNSEVVKILFDPAWERIKSLTGWSKYGELSNLLGIKQASVSGAKKRGFIALEWLFSVAQSYNGSTDWLATGEGAIKRGDQGEHEAVAAKEAVEANIADLSPVKAAAVNYIGLMSDNEAAEIVKIIIHRQNDPLLQFTGKDKEELIKVMQEQIRKAKEYESLSSEIDLKQAGT